MTRRPHRAPSRVLPAEEPEERSPLSKGASATDRDCLLIATRLLDLWNARESSEAERLIRSLIGLTT